MTQRCGKFVMHKTPKTVKMVSLKRGYPLPKFLKKVFTSPKGRW